MDIGDIKSNFPGEQYLSEKDKAMMINKNDQGGENPVQKYELAGKLGKELGLEKLDENQTKRLNRLFNPSSEGETTITAEQASVLTQRFTKMEKGRQIGKLVGEKLALPVAATGALLLYHEAAPFLKEGSHMQATLEQLGGLTEEAWASMDKNKLIGRLMDFPAIALAAGVGGDLLRKFSRAKRGDKSTLTGKYHSVIERIGGAVGGKIGEKVVEFYTSDNVEKVKNTFRSRRENAVGANA